MLSTVDGNGGQTPPEKDLHDAYERVQANASDPGVAALLERIARLSQIGSILTRETRRFGVPQGDLDTVSILWEVMRKMPAWLGWRPFLGYFVRNLRGHLSGAARNLRGIRRLTDTEIDLLELIQAEFPRRLSNTSLAAFLTDNAGAIGDKAAEKLNWSHRRTERSLAGLGRKRGMSVVGLDETVLMDTRDPPSVAPCEDGARLFVQRLTQDLLIPPPPTEEVAAMIEARLQADEDSSLKRVWEELAASRADIGHSPKQWARRFFMVKAKLDARLRLAYPNVELLTAFERWLHKDGSNGT